MSQKSIELILFRQLAEYLVQPIFIVDPEGNLVFCNEAMEKILGFRFSDTGEMPAKEWSTIFLPQDQQGNPLQTEKNPLTISATEHRPAHDAFYIRNIKGKVKLIEILTLPIVNKMNTFLGTIIFIKELEE